MMAAAKIFAVLLAVFSVAAAEVPKEPATCLHPVVCPCGTTGKNVTFCTEVEQKEDICNQWSNCKACQDGLEGCLECLEGFLCSKATASISCPDPGLFRNGYKTSSDSQLNNGQTGPSDGSEYLPGSRVQYRCSYGFILKGNRSLVCQNTGLWSSKAPVCRRASVVFCREPGIDAKGDREPRSMPGPLGWPASTVLHYSCAQGYNLKGKDTLFCLSRGQWTSERPSCVPNGDVPLYNGEEVTPGDFPWVVAIGDQRNGYVHLICAGALLDRRTVVTAAHCLTRGGPFTLYFGKHYRYGDRDKATVERRTVSDILVHPDFHPENSLDSDIALVKFRPPVDYSRLVRPVRLPTAETAVRHLASGSTGSVIGWGFNEKQAESEEVMYVDLPYVNNTACEESLREFVRVSGPLLTRNMFCAGYSDARQTTCKGDSGSPMVFYDFPSRTYTLEGLVSFSVRGQCGLPGRYSVFTRVHRFLPWIVGNMRVGESSRKRKKNQVQSNRGIRSPMGTVQK